MCLGQTPHIKYELCKNDKCFIIIHFLRCRTAWWKFSPPPTPPAPPAPPPLLPPLQRVTQSGFRLSFKLISLRFPLWHLELLSKLPEHSKSSMQWGWVTLTTMYDSPQRLGIVNNSSGRYTLLYEPKIQHGVETLSLSLCLPLHSVPFLSVWNYYSPLLPLAFSRSFFLCIFIYIYIATLQ